MKRKENWIRSSRGVLAGWALAGCAAVGGLLLAAQRDDRMATSAGDLRRGPARVPAWLGRQPRAAGWSDVVQWPGSDEVLVVDDDEDHSLLRWRLAAEGEADGEPERLPLPPGLKLNDGEALATDGTYLYALSSHALKRDRSERRSTLQRFRLNERGLEPAGSVTDLKLRVAARFPELAAVAALPADEGGLNFEGMAWDSRRSRLLLGLRGPLLDSRPAVVPVAISGRGEELELVFDQPLLRIEGILGFGIRGLSADPLTGGLLVLTGGVGPSASGAAGKNRFALWRWTGRAGELAAQLLEFPGRLGEAELKPEGACRVVLAGGRHFVLVVTDGSPVYWKIPLAAVPSPAP